LAVVVVRRQNPDRGEVRAVHRLADGCDDEVECAKAGIERLSPTQLRRGVRRDVADLRKIWDPEATPLAATRKVLRLLKDVNLK